MEPEGSLAFGKSPQMEPIVSPLNTTHTLTTILIIYFHLRLGIPGGGFRFVRISHCSYACYIPRHLNSYCSRMRSYAVKFIRNTEPRET